MTNIIAYLEQVGYSPEEISNIQEGIPLTPQSPKITDAKHVYKLLHEYSTKPKEHFICITLDGASNVINKYVIHIGTINQSLVHPREVFYPAIKDLAVGIIIAHNHPSGTLEPSRADINITQRLHEVGKLVGIDLLDHIIISKEGYYSFSDEGLI